MEAWWGRREGAGGDGLRVASRPGKASPFGLYRLRRKGQAERPYRSLLESVEPLRGSCDCPDFSRNALGTCKHLLCVVDELAARGGQRAGKLDAAAGGGEGEGWGAERGGADRIARVRGGALDRAGWGIRCGPERPGRPERPERPERCIDGRAGSGSG